MLKNPELIKTITFTATLNKNTGLFDFKGGLATKTQSGQVKKTLDVIYLSKTKLFNEYFLILLFNNFLFKNKRRKQIDQPWYDQHNEFGA